MVSFSQIETKDEQEIKNLIPKNPEQPGDRLRPLLHKVTDTDPLDSLAVEARDAMVNYGTAGAKNTVAPAGRASGEGVAMKPAQKGARKSAKSTTVTVKKFKRFTEEEHGAMRERVQELKADEADGERAVLAKIAEMPDSDRAMGKRLHSIIKASAPALSPRLWYGMPAYAKDGKVVCFFQNAQRFKTRYATFGFSDKANLAEEARIGALVKKAVS